MIPDEGGPDEEGEEGPEEESGEASGGRAGLTKEGGRSRRRRRRRGGARPEGARVEPATGADRKPCRHLGAGLGRALATGAASAAAASRRARPELGPGGMGRLVPRRVLWGLLVAGASCTRPAPVVVIALSVDDLGPANEGTIVAHLRDSDEATRDAAVRLLVARRSLAALPPLLAQLKDPTSTWSVGRWACWWS